MSISFSYCLPVNLQSIFSKHSIESSSILGSAILFVILLQDLEI